MVRTNREHPPDYVVEHLEQLAGDKPFDDLGRFVTQAELERLSADYKRIAGFALETWSSEESLATASNPHFQPCVGRLVTTVHVTQADGEPRRELRWTPLSPLPDPLRSP